MIRRPRKVRNPQILQSPPQTLVNPRSATPHDVFEDDTTQEETDSTDEDVEGDAIESADVTESDASEESESLLSRFRCERTIQHLHAVNKDRVFAVGDAGSILW